MSPLTAAKTEIVWSVLPDPRDQAMREADREIDSARDEPSGFWRCYEDAMALCGEVDAIAEKRNNHPAIECPGCRQRRLRGVDLVARAMLTVVEGALRTQSRSRRARLRLIARESQTVLFA